MTEKIILEIPASTLTEIMKSVEECSTANDKLYREFSQFKLEILTIKNELLNLRTEIEDMKSTRKRKKFFVF